MVRLVPKKRGEGSLSSFLPALVNAVADAIGVRATDLPLTPERVLELVEKQKKAARLAQAAE